jgi:hypothetical protein
MDFYRSQPHGALYPDHLDFTGLLGHRDVQTTRLIWLRAGHCVLNALSSTRASR